MHLAHFITLLLLAAKIEGVPLLMSWMTSIKYIDEDSIVEMRSVVPNTHLAIAVDYHYNRNEIYFSDSTEQIKRAWLTPPNSTVEPISIANVGVCDGLAVDWVGDNLYWTDITNKVVETSTLDGLYRRVLFDSSHGVDKPRGIALDPFEGIMFWTDWGSKEKVESSGLDGKAKRTIMDTNLIWPNGITLDLNKKTVYILEARWAKLISCKYDGSSRVTIYISDDYLEEAFGLTFFRNKLYWDSWKKEGVYSLDPSSESEVQMVLKRLGKQDLKERMMGIKAVDPSLQKELTVTNPCKNNGCSHKCVNGRSLSATCICPYGFTLQPDKKTCSEDGYLLMSWKKFIRRYNFKAVNEEKLFSRGEAVIALAYHNKKNLLFWSDIVEHRIYRAPLGNLQNKTVVVTTENSDGLAVDWVHDVLYWTDSAQNTLEAAQLDGFKRKIIFSDDLDEPRDIAVDPESGYMFWTDWGSNPKLERAVLDGSERRKIVNQAIFWPNGITLDLVQRRVYWVDGKLGTISSTLYDGSARIISELSTNNAAMRPFGITVFNNKVYWTDWNLRALLTAEITKKGLSGGVELANTSSTILRPQGVKVVHSALQRDQVNPCATMKCTDLCLGTKSPQKGHCLDEEDSGDSNLTKDADSKIIYRRREEL